MSEEKQAHEYKRELFDKALKEIQGGLYGGQTHQLFLVNHFSNHVTTEDIMALDKAYEEKLIFANVRAYHILEKARSQLMETYLKKRSLLPNFSEVVGEIFAKCPTYRGFITDDITYPDQQWLVHLSRIQIMGAQGHFTNAFDTANLKSLLGNKAVYEKLTADDIVTLIDGSASEYKANKQKLEDKKKDFTAPLYVNEKVLADQRIAALNTGKDFSNEVINKWFSLTTDKTKKEALTEAFLLHYPNKKEWWNHFQKQSLEKQGQILDTIFTDSEAKKALIKTLAEDKNIPPALVLLCRNHIDRLTRDSKDFISEYKLTGLQPAHLQEIQRHIRNNIKPDNKEDFSRGEVNKEIAAILGVDSLDIMSKSEVLSESIDSIYYGLNKRKAHIQHAIDDVSKDKKGVQFSKENFVKLVLALGYQQETTFGFSNIQTMAFSIPKFLARHLKNPDSKFHKVAQEVNEIVSKWPKLRTKTLLSKTEGKLLPPALIKEGFEASTVPGGSSYSKDNAVALLIKYRPPQEGSPISAESWYKAFYSNNQEYISVQKAVLNHLLAGNNLTDTQKKDFLTALYQSDFRFGKNPAFEICQKHKKFRTLIYTTLGIPDEKASILSPVDKIQVMTKAKYFEDKASSEIHAHTPNKIRKSQLCDVLAAGFGFKYEESLISGSNQKNIEKVNKLVGNFEFDKDGWLTKVGIRDFMIFALNQKFQKASFAFLSYQKSEFSTDKMLDVIKNSTKLCNSFQFAYVNLKFIQGDIRSNELSGFNYNSDQVGEEILRGYIKKHAITESEILHFPEKVLPPPSVNPDLAILEAREAKGLLPEAERPPKFNPNLIVENEQIEGISSPDSQLIDLKGTPEQPEQEVNLSPPVSPPPFNPEVVALGEVRKEGQEKVQIEQPLAVAPTFSTGYESAMSNWSTFFPVSKNNVPPQEQEHLKPKKEPREKRVVIIPS